MAGLVSASSRSSHAAPTATVTDSPRGRSRPRRVESRCTPRPVTHRCALVCVHVSRCGPPPTCGFRPPEAAPPSWLEATTRAGRPCASLDLELRHPLPGSPRCGRRRARWAPGARRRTRAGGRRSVRSERPRRGRPSRRSARAARRALGPSVGTRIRWVSTRRRHRFAVPANQGCCCDTCFVARCHSTGVHRLPVCALDGSATGPNGPPGGCVSTAWRGAGRRPARVDPSGGVEDCHRRPAPSSQDPRQRWSPTGSVPGPDPAWLAPSPRSAPPRRRR